MHGKEPELTEGKTIRWAKRYDIGVEAMYFGRGKRYRERLLDLVGVKAGEKTLDVGCGTGRLVLAALPDLTAAADVTCACVQGGAEDGHRVDIGVVRVAETGRVRFGPVPAVRCPPDLTAAGVVECPHVEVGAEDGHRLRSAVARVAEEVFVLRMSRQSGRQVIYELGPWEIHVQSDNRPHDKED